MSFAFDIVPGLRFGLQSGLNPGRVDIVTAVLDSGADTTNTTSFATASISPVANALVILSVWSEQGSGQAVEPTASGAGMTWVAIHTVNSGPRRLIRFRAMSASPGSGALTVDYGATEQASYCWGVEQYEGVDTSGTDGSGAIVQAPAITTGTTVTTLSATLNAFENAKNVHSAAVGATINDVITHDPDFTELYDVTTISAPLTQDAMVAVNELSCDPTFASAGVAMMSNIEIKAGS